MTTSIDYAATADVMGCGAAPHRVRLSRTKGFRLPENTVKVDRSSKQWGNAFRVGQPGVSTRKCAVERFALVMRAPEARLIREQARRELRGKNLACWCPLDGPCHADVLLELANEERHNNQLFGAVSAPEEGRVRHPGTIS